MGRTAEASILLILLIHLGLKIFAKVDMELMWILISLLQIIISFAYINGLPIPANLQYFLQILTRCVYFKVTEVPAVKDFIDKTMGTFKESVSSGGNEVIILSVLLIAVGLIVIVGILVKKRESLREKVEDLKKKLIWTPVLSFILQSYYPLLLSAFAVIPHPPSQSSLIVSSIKLFFLIIFPVASYSWLRLNKLNL